MRAPAATVKYYEIARNELSEVERGINTLKTYYLINSAPDDDISEMIRNDARHAARNFYARGN